MMTYWTLFLLINLAQIQGVEIKGISFLSAATESQHVSHMVAAMSNVPMDIQSDSTDLESGEELYHSIELVTSSSSTGDVIEHNRRRQQPAGWISRPTITYDVCKTIF